MPLKTKNLLLFFSALTWIGSTTPSECLATDVGLIVPAYGNPCCDGGPAMWAQLTDTAAVMGANLLVILNPASGPGIGTIDPNYVDGSGHGPFIDFRNAGGVAIGYVRTGWTARPLSEVKNEVDLYFNPAYWRGAGVQIQGIFFDEMSNDLADVGYYQSLRDHVRGHSPTAIVVGNPGTSFVNNPSGQSTWSVADYAETADTLVTFESDADEYFNNYSTPPWLAGYPAERFGNIVYGVETAAQMLEAMSLAKQRKAGYVYLTDDILVNPYDYLPSYWPAEGDAAQSLIFADGFESGGMGSWMPNTAPSSAAASGTINLVFSTNFRNHPIRMNP